MATSDINLNQNSSSQGTGIDVTSIVDQIIFTEQAPERIWQQQQLALAAQTSSLNSLSSGVNALKDNVQALSDLSGVFSSQLGTSSQPGLVNVSAQPNAAAGVHTLVIDHLATVSSYYTEPVTDSSTTLAHGTLTLSGGQGTNLITIDATNDTLDKLSTYINAHNYGVQTSVINDADALPRRSTTSFPLITQRLAALLRSSGQVPTALPDHSPAAVRFVPCRVLCFQM